MYRNILQVHVCVCACERVCIYISIHLPFNRTRAQQSLRSDYRNILYSHFVATANAVLYSNLLDWLLFVFRLCGVCTHINDPGWVKTKGTPKAADSMKLIHGMSDLQVHTAPRRPIELRP